MTPQPLRSRNWFGRQDLDGFAHRSWLKTEGYSDLVFDGRPVIGIGNSWSELTNCNAHLRQVADAVKRGVWSAGGFPLEFPTISLGEVLMKPTTMLFRNLMAMDVEECIRAYPLDAVVLLSGCDKTTPAMLMGAASADVPTIMVTGGPMLRGVWRQEELGTSPAATVGCSSTTCSRPTRAATSTSCAAARRCGRRTPRALRTPDLLYYPPDLTDETVFIAL